MSLIVSALIAIGVLAVAMALLWLVARRVENYAIVDVAWSFSFALVVILYLLLSDQQGFRSQILTGLVIVWSVRLGSHLYSRVVGKPEEGRYRTLRESWKDRPGLKFFLFYQMQALSVVLLSLPFLLTFHGPNQNMTILQWVGLALAAVSVLGEGIADYQLRQFIAEPNNKGKVCNQGLWAWSRHPNYFFESLIWVAFALFALDAPWGWLALLSPFIIWHLILNVTGIPPTEEQCLKSRGEAYRLYQQTTSAFIPMPPKRREQSKA